MKKISRILLVLLAAVMCLGCFAACKSSNGKGKDTKPDDPIVNPGDDEDNFVYTYGKTNYEPGTEFTFLNLNTLWNMYIYLDATSDGSSVDKAVYRRNRLVEKDMDCVIRIDEHQWTYEFAPYLNKISNAILNNLSPWDAIYLPINQRADLITSGCFRDLSDISNINLGGKWWDDELNHAFMISDRLYFASSPFQLMSFDTDRKSTRLNSSHRN